MAEIQTDEYQDVHCVANGLAYKLHCPKCGNELPMLRKPDGIGQALLGGWTCGQCDSRIDRLGKLIKECEDESQ